jgi:hypothetical protein
MRFLFRRLRGAPQIALLVAGLAAAPMAARAEEPGALRDFCAERPGRATPSCIVDPGHWMVEVDAYDVVRSRDAGVIERVTTALSPHIRLGLTSIIEAGVVFVPFTETRTSDAFGHATVHGTGDTTVNLKISLKNPGGDGPSVAILPFVSIPTAQHSLGLGGFQGGVIVPVALSLPAGFGLTLDPEVDAIRNGHGGTGAAYTMAASLSHGLGTGFTGGVEIWASQFRTPGSWERLATADASLAWIPAKRPNLQLDGGVNLGLTHHTPKTQAYVGVSRRF